eukprot:s2363_g9.t1
MSSNHGEGIEVSVDLPGLRVVVTGAPGLVADFVQFVSTFQPARARSPTASAGSFELLSEAPEPATPATRGGIGLETRDQIASTFPACPGRLFYAVARAAGVPCPVIYRSSASYWRALGSLEGSNSVSQSFPSESEARIYLQAAGFDEDSISVLP